MIWNRLYFSVFLMNLFLFILCRAMMHHCWLRRSYTTSSPCASYRVYSSLPYPGGPSFYGISTRYRCRRTYHSPGVPIKTNIDCVVQDEQISSRTLILVVLSYIGKHGSGWKAGKESTPIATPFVSGWGVTGKFHPASNVRIRIGKSRIETIQHKHSSVPIWTVVTFLCIFHCNCLHIYSHVKLVGSASPDTRNTTSQRAFCPLFLYFLN